MANSKMLRGTTEWRFDPLGPLISTVIFSNALVALGTGTNSVTRLAINGGAVRMLGDTNEAADMVLSGPLSFQVNKAGLLTLQARIRINTSLLTAAVFVGMADIVTTGSLSYEDAAVVSTPADGFGLLFEGEQLGTAANGLYTLGVGNDVDDTIRNVTNVVIPTIATFFTVMIQADSGSQGSNTDTGVVRYRTFIDGVLIDTAATDARGWTTSRCRSTVLLAPVIQRAGRATAYSVDVPELTCIANIGDAFD